MRKLITLALILGLGVPVFARVTGSPPTNADAFCTGPDGAEVCVDASGNVIPTTDNDADLGTSTLGWKDGYIDGTLHVGALSITAGGITTAMIGSDSIITAKLSDSAVTTQKMWLDLTPLQVVCITTSKMLGVCTNINAATGVCNACN